MAEFGGAFQSTINTFTNFIEFEAYADQDHVRIGQPVTIKLESQFSNVEYDVNSPFPVEQIDSNTFVVTPDKELENAEIVITSSLNGFSPVQKQIFISSENKVEVTVNAKTKDGKILSPFYNYFIGNNTGSTTAPHIHSTPPHQFIIEIDDDYSTISGGYRYVNAEIDGEIIESAILDFYPVTDTNVTLFYDQFVNVVVNNGQGSGIYSYGDKVRISAPDNPKIPFLLVEKFESWDENNNGSTFTVEVTHDMVFNANYKDDYTGTMLIIIISVIISVVFAIRKGDSTIQFHLRNIYDTISSKLKLSDISIHKIRK